MSDFKSQLNMAAIEALREQARQEQADDYHRYGRLQSVQVLPHLPSLLLTPRVALAAPAQLDVAHHAPFTAHSPTLNPNAQVFVPTSHPGLTAQTLLEASHYLNVVSTQEVNAEGMAAPWSIPRSKYYAEMPAPIPPNKLRSSKKSKSPPALLGALRPGGPSSTLGWLPTKDTGRWGTGFTVPWGSGYLRRMAWESSP